MEMWAIPNPIFKNNLEKKEIFMLTKIQDQLK